MIVLALDTALSAASAAILDGGRTLAVRSEPMERGHQERLAGLVRDTMAAAGIGFAALERIGVTVGPGSFTGLRVGLAFAKGLGLALDIPCVGVGTLEALAASADRAGTVVAAIDARRDQIYLQVFRDGVPSTAPEVLPLADAQRRVADFATGSLTMVGPGAALLQAREPATLDARPFADPLVLARLTLAATVPISRPEPIYLRAPDARTIAERAAGR